MPIFGLTAPVPRSVARLPELTTGEAAQEIIPRRGSTVVGDDKAFLELAAAYVGWALPARQADRLSARLVSTGSPYHAAEGVAGHLEVPICPCGCRKPAL